MPDMVRWSRNQFVLEDVFVLMDISCRVWEGEDGDVDG